MSVNRVANCPIWRCKLLIATVKVSNADPALAVAGDVAAGAGGWEKMGGGAPVLATNTATGVVLGCVAAVAAAKMPAAVAA